MFSSTKYVLEADSVYSHYYQVSSIFYSLASPFLEGNTGGVGAMGATGSVVVACRTTGTHATSSKIWLVSSRITVWTWWSGRLRPMPPQQWKGLNHRLGA